MNSVIRLEIRKSLCHMSDWNENRFECLKKIQTNLLETFKCYKAHIWSVSNLFIKVKIACPLFSQWSKGSFFFNWRNPTVINTEYRFCPHLLLWNRYRAKQGRQIVRVKDTQSHSDATRLRQISLAVTENRSNDTESRDRGEWQEWSVRISPGYWACSVVWDADSQGCRSL